MRALVFGDPNLVSAAARQGKSTGIRPIFRGRKHYFQPWPAALRVCKLVLPSRSRYLRRVVVVKKMGSNGCEKNLVLLTVDNDSETAE